MKFAHARELITPPISVKMSGYANRTEKFSGIHDDLYVKTAYMENKETNLLIITFDLCHYLYSLNERIMDYVFLKYDIPAQNVIINYSHTHAGSKIISPSEKAEEPSLDSFYFERAKTCIDRAFLNIYEGSLKVAKTSGRWNVNRRKQSESGFVMEPNHTDITDDEVYLLVARDMQNKIKMIFINYSCHPVTLSNTLYISGEFPGRLCNILESKYYGAMAFFLQGAAGNMRPLITADKGKFKACTFDELDEFASSIARKIDQTICSNHFAEINPDFKSIKFEINLPINPYSLEKLQGFYREVEDILKSRIQKTIDNYHQISDEILVHCGIVKFSPDLFFAYMGGEICYEVKQIVQQVFKPAQVVFLGYHEALTYIPDDKIIAQGGYEGLNAPLYSGFRGPLKPGIDTIIALAFKKNLKKLD